MRRPFVAGLILALSIGAIGVPPQVSAETSLRDDPIGEVADFALTERSGDSVRKADLAGKVWIACFFFTHCSTVCPQVTQTMHRVQEQIQKLGYPDVVLVSFTVDPERDTPEVLQAYATAFGADSKGWLFLTGKEDDIHRLSKEGFYLSASRTEGKELWPGNEFSHSSRLVLVDREGKIRGLYDGRIADAETKESIDDVPRLVRDIARLRGGYFEVDQITQPSTNAILNAASAVLLIMGYLAIRAGGVGLHKACMLMALAVSSVFLTSYLYYHFVIRGGEPTRFTGPDGVRMLYLGILLTHTVLAAATAPLALITAYLGLSGRLPRHKKLARWTLPIWLYVSITGVVVYWMLYRLYPGG